MKRQNKRSSTTKATSRRLWWFLCSTTTPSRQRSWRCLSSTWPSLTSKCKPSSRVVLIHTPASCLMKPLWSSAKIKSTGRWFQWFSFFSAAHGLYRRTSLPSPSKTTWYPGSRLCSRNSSRIRRTPLLWFKTMENSFCQTLRLSNCSNALGIWRWTRMQAFLRCLLIDRMLSTRILNIEIQNTSWILIQSWRAKKVTTASSCQSRAWMTRAINRFFCTKSKFKAWFLSSNHVRLSFYTTFLNFTKTRS